MTELEVKCQHHLTDKRELRASLSEVQKNNSDMMVSCQDPVENYFKIIYFAFEKISVWVCAKQTLASEIFYKSTSEARKKHGSGAKTTGAKCKVRIAFLTIGKGSIIGIYFESSGIFIFRLKKMDSGDLYI